jgi:hypothetical protein
MPTGDLSPVGDGGQGLSATHFMCSICCCCCCCCWQIRALRSKLKDSRAAAEVLTAELAGLKITLAEREAELAAINSCRVSMERPASAGARMRVWAGPLLVFSGDVDAWLLVRMWLFMAAHCASDVRQS